VGQNDGKGDGSTCATPALRIALATEHLLLRGCASLSREPSSPFLRPPSCSLSPNRFQPPRSSSTRGAITFPRTAAAAACRPAPHSASDGTACKSRRRANTSVLYASDHIGCPRLMHPSKVPNLESGRGRSAQPFRDTLVAVLPTQPLMFFPTRSGEGSPNRETKEECTICIHIHKPDKIGPQPTSS
jgi:hypothetical protein